MDTPAWLHSKKLQDGTILILAVAAVKLAIHVIANLTGGYGYFRDELYYLACAERLDIGYVDHPPLSIFILAANRFILGDSLFALRLIPAVLGAAVVVLTGLMTREMGGDRFAQFLAAVCSLVSIIFLAFSSLYSMNSIDVFLWTLAAYVTLVLIRTKNPRYWLLLGLVLGLGTMNKISMLWLAFGLFLAFLLTSHRKWFVTPWPYIAGAITFLFCLPYVIWNFQHDFATLEFMHNATVRKYASQNPLTFLSGLLLLNNPLTAPLWISGVLTLLFWRKLARFRILGIAFLTVVAILIINIHSKSEYLAAGFGIVFAAGAVAVGAGLAAQRWMWVKPVYVVLLAASGMIFAPLAIPILPVETFITYSRTVIPDPPSTEGQRLGELPQHFADMFGWHEKAAAVATVYNSLTPEEKEKCAVFGDNYGRSAALDFFGRHYGLPPALGSHNSYWIWGPGKYSGELVIVLGGALEDKQRAFERVEIAGEVSSKYCMPYENNLRIYICRNLRQPLRELWPTIKVFI